MTRPLTFPELLADACAIDCEQLRGELVDAIRARMEYQAALYAALDSLAQLTQTNGRLTASLRQATAEVRRLHQELRNARAEAA